jgi:hypothetical protein
MRNARWMSIVAAIVFAALVGAFAYTLGLAHGEDGSGTWHHAWPPGFFFGPLFFILFWFVVLRGFFWRRGWHHGGCGRRSLDDWHRDAHERMWNDPSGGGTATR